MNAERRVSENVFVRVVKGSDAKENAYLAISDVFTGDAENSRVLLKVNTGFKGSARSGLCTNPDVVVGLIRFFKERRAGQIMVGDSSIVGVDSIEALTAAGIMEVCREEGVDCVDLNSFPPVEKKISSGIMVDHVIFSELPYRCDIVVSVPVMKTHMYTGATLSIKNMKGAMYKREKTKLHRLQKPLPEGASARALDYGLLDLTTVCYPDYAVIDGSVCMEGFGPSGGTPKEMGLVIASGEPAAADLVALRLMEIPLSSVGHLTLISSNRGISYDNIRVEPAEYERYSQKFVTAAEARLDVSCDAIKIEDESACSACHAALIQFLRYHAHEFEGEKLYTIFAGKDTVPDAVQASENPFVIGNCTAKFEGIVPFCKGCPPIPSEITKTLKGEIGLKIKYLGHSCFQITSKEYSLLIDPFLSGSPFETVKAEDVKATHVFVTHGHDDHFGDAASIAARCGATAYATVETAGRFPDGVNVEVGQIGGFIRSDFGGVKFTAATHGSGVPGGLACGFLIELDGKKIYHAGDTGLTMDMALLADENIDIALLPIGDRFTMGPKDALRAVSLVKPKRVVPMHYDTWPPINQDVEQFKKDVESATGIPVSVLTVGGSFDL
jgi:L-ascorbate metabolism protein UlaG (beta-lactamase superfamily)/uncharacterized protein (DUF362 family)